MEHKSRVIAIVLAASLAVTGKAFAQAIEAPSLPAGVAEAARLEGITEYRLANGLKIVLDPMPAAPETVLHVVYNVGSRDDVPGKTGYAHLLEHMLFKGTPKIPDAKAALLAQGINANAFTWADRTDYVARFPAQIATLDWLVDFEADRMTQAGFTEHDLQTEMTVVRNEFEIARGVREAVLSEAVRGAAYVFHPYGRPTIGQRDDIEHVDFAALRALYRARYRPDNATVVIAGRFDVREALGRIVNSFGQLPVAGPLPPAASFTEPAQRGERDVHLYLPGMQSLLDVAWHVPAARHADTAALLVLAQMLSSDGDGLLGKTFVQGGRATRVQAEVDLLRDPGLFWVRVSPVSGQGLPGLRDDLAAALESGLGAHLDIDAMRAAKQRIAAFAASSAAQAPAVADQLARGIALGDWRLMAVLRDACAAVTLEDVNRVAATYLSRYNRISGFLHAAQTTVGVDVPAAPELQGQLAAWAATAAASVTASAAATAAPVRGESITLDAPSLDFATQRLEPAPGLRLALLRKRLAGDQARVHLDLHFGSAEQDAGFTAAQRLMPAMLLAGSATRPHAALLQDMSALDISLHISTRPQAMTVAITGPARNMPAALDIVSELMRSPRFDEADLQRIRQAQLSEIENEADKPAARLRQRYAQLLNDARHAAPGDPAYRWEPPLMSDALRNASVADLKRYQQALWSAPDIRVAALGDIDAKPFAAALQHAFANRPKSERIEPPATPHVDIPGQRLHAPMAGAANVSLDATEYFSMRPDDEDHWPLALAVRMLAGQPDSRLWHRLREQLGASYIVNSDFGISPGGDSAHIDIRSTFAPSETDAVLRAIGEEIERARRDGFSSVELDRARRTFNFECPGAKDIEDFLVCVLGHQIDKGQTFADWAYAARQVMGVTNWQASQALRKYIDWKRFVVATAGDIGGSGVASAAAPASAGDR